MPKAKSFAEVAELFDRMGDAVRGEDLAAVALAGAEVVRVDASDRAPADTGNLKRNIVAEVTEIGESNAVAAVGPNKDAWYGVFVELGTSQMPPEPFLRPAFEQNVDAAVEEMGKAILGLLEEEIR